MDSRQVVDYVSDTSQSVWGWVKRRLQTTPTAVRAAPTTASTSSSTTLSKGRNKSSYAQNKTASLSLPEESINEINARRRNQPLTSYALINDAIDWISDYIPDFSQKKPKIVYEFVVEDPDSPIADHITSLETRIQKIMKDTNKFSELSPADQAKVDEFNRQKVILLKDNIKEHAYRRVELFFYMLIAVWRQNIKIEKKGGAKAQHGTGSKERGTAGCHSFPLTNLEFSKLPGTFDWLLGPGQLHTLEETHFIESINSTMELPVPVNQFDKHLEGMYGMSNRMKAALELLNKCARNEITPVEGITQYFMIMDDFFKHHHDKYIANGDKNKIDHPEANKKIWEYQQDGTFNATLNKGTLIPSDEFLGMTLGMSVNEVRLAKITPMLFHKHYRRIQDEIYNSEPVEAHRERKGPKA